MSKEQTLQLKCKNCGEEYTLSWSVESSPSNIAMGIEIVLNERQCDVCDEIDWLQPNPVQEKQE